MGSVRRSNLLSVFSNESLRNSLPRDDPARENADLDDNHLAVGTRPYQAGQRPDTSSAIYSSSPIPNQKTPGRSFYHRSFHGNLEPIQYSSQGVRQQTAELASLALSDTQHARESSLSNRPLTGLSGNATSGSRRWSESQSARRLQPVGEHGGPDMRGHSDLPNIDPGESALTHLIRHSPPDGPDQESSDLLNDSLDHGNLVNEETFVNSATHDEGDELPNTDTERTSLMPKKSRESADKSYGAFADPETQAHGRYVAKHQESNVHHAMRTLINDARDTLHLIGRPKLWSGRGIYTAMVKKPLSTLPAVFLGLLLNILDALSYGMILFPLGQPVFSELGSDGISIFYVSTIISQLVFSCGGSIFRGGIGSEMIEVVPFFHSMAFKILSRVGESNGKSVLATTITSYAISSILTGAVFFLMGVCHLGSLIGFFPRHILIGCIGGVGWFLVATGVEVSARLDGNLEYNTGTLSKLFQSDTIFLWLIPLILAIVLYLVKRHVRSNFLVGGYFVGVAGIFYFFKFALQLPLGKLRTEGWVFDAPAKGNPWYHFYTLYDFGAVDWSAIAECVPAMFALTFFGVLHVPINVPALGISTGEDNLNVDRELIAHGVSNALSGFAGSIQNYLVYTNSLLFIDSGGDTRLAGILLAAATFGILLAGPVIIGYIPIMVVGALIFLLGIELLEEAIVDTWGRVHRLEYLTILVIVITMGAWDFVVGILVGIILACVNFVVQTSRRSAIRATYSGQIATSTVRRHPLQLQFLKEVGKQTYVIKLAGFLFFGTIVGVENRIRDVLAEDKFSDRPIRFLVLDLSHVNGVDFSAAEAFTRINRLLRKKFVNLVLSGFDIEGDVGDSLRNVGLFSEQNEVELFVNLNEALEYCENDFLKVLYRRQESLRHRHASHTTDHLEVPKSSVDQSPPTETIFSSPRRNHLFHVAASALPDQEAIAPRKWSSFKQPLPLMLQIFDGLSDKNEDFWFPACRYFERKEIPLGSKIYCEGDDPETFVLLEDGILRAEYDVPQGKYSELIVAGRPCGELPFFSETQRTATVTAERDSVIWQLDTASWIELQRAEPDIARELLKVGLKLTKERMDVITSYVLTTAG